MLKVPASITLCTRDTRNLENVFTTTGNSNKPTPLSHTYEDPTSPSNFSLNARGHEKLSDLQSTSDKSIMCQISLHLLAITVRISIRIIFPAAFLSFTLLLPSSPFQVSSSLWLSFSLLFLPSFSSPLLRSSGVNSKHPPTLGIRQLLGLSPRSAAIPVLVPVFAASLSFLARVGSATEQFWEH